ncbi:MULTISPECIES: hypothetical protein [unclassified Bradyrhizobium]|uniref:hypothetical protein n=1 Tax=unclassified Bradyrhizobium TaxID=2631580 RepID=UPI002915E4AF|nr:MULTISPECIES: hypothetical protein [unclassified Bradyrhizobium]
MFAEPTINDFLDNIRWHLKKAGVDAGRTVAAIQAELASKGLLLSGRAVISIFDAVRKDFEGGINATLGELKRTIARTTLDRIQLRQMTIQCLENFAIEMKSLTKADQYRTLVGKLIDDRLREFDEYLSFAIRQFDTGFLDPPEPEVPSVNNSINIGTMTGSAVQQGSPSAAQTMQLGLKIDDAKAAAAAFEAAIQSIDLPISKKDEIVAELQTISAQLSKKSPSLTILREAGCSLRNVVEGITASAITPQLLAAAPMLWSALGLG